MLLAGWRAVREYDLKLILAFGTVSQLGLITVLVGAGGGDLMLAGLAMLCAHAMFKAALFMVVGIIDHATGTRDIRRLAWLGQRSRPLLVIAVGATASMAALPPFLGFVAKEADFETLLHSAVTGPVRRPACWPASWSGRCSPPSTACGSSGVRSRARDRPTQQARRRACTARRPRSWSRPAILAAAGLVFGLWPPAAGRLLDPYADTVPGGGGLPPGAVARLRTCRCCCRSLVLAVGTAAFFGRARLRRQRDWAALPLGNADRIYDAVMRGAGPALGRGHRHHPARFASRRPSR